MIDALALTITLLCLGTAAVVGAQTVAGSFAWPRVGPVLILVEVALLVLAVLDLVGLAGGRPPREPGPHFAYLLTSILLGPVVVAEARRTRGRWGPTMLVLGLAATAVIVVRLRATGRPAGG